MYEILKNNLVQREVEAADETQLVNPNPVNDTLTTLKILNKIPNVVFAYTVPIVGIVFGIWYFHECPAQPKIPVMVVCLFSLYVLDITLKLPNAFRPSDVTQNPSPLLCISSVVQCCILGIFISLCYWVYSTHPLTEVSQRSDPNYCDYLFYNVAFWGTTTLLTLMSISIPVWVIAVCCIGVARAQQAQTN